MEKTYLTLAVIELSGTKEADIKLQERESLTDVIRGIARKHLPVTQWIILTRENIKEQLDSGMDISNCVDKCVIEVGRKLKIDYLVSGNITRLGTNLQVTLNYYDIDDIEMGNIKGSAWASGKDVDNLIAPLEKTSDSLFSSLAKLHPIEDKPEKKKSDSKQNKDWDARASGVEVPSKHFGVGVHWAPVFGLKVNGDAGDISSGDLIQRNFKLEQNGVAGLQGFGLKFWVGDYLETSWNMQYGYYDANLVADTSRYPLQFDLGRPLLASMPYFSRYAGDVTVFYPINLSGLYPTVKFHAGGGLAVSMATKVMTVQFAQDAINKAIDQNTSLQTGTNDDFVRVIDDAFKKEGSVIGFGAFVQLGGRYTLSFMPCALYLDTKYHLFFSNPDLVSGPDISLELGAAFIF